MRVLFYRWWWRAEEPQLHDRINALSLCRVKKSGLEKAFGRTEFPWCLERNRSVARDLCDWVLRHRKWCGGSDLISDARWKLKASPGHRWQKWFATVLCLRADVASNWKRRDRKPPRWRRRWRRCERNRLYSRAKYSASWAGRQLRSAGVLARSNRYIKSHIGTSVDKFETIVAAGEDARTPKTRESHAAGVKMSQ